ncbi:DUF3108 domain-containing protein [Mycoplana dimorpha]|uniref:Uncharacterized protein DUF3108 n=1 Tax=Mycoplana dimorpha TaxID=28320 RepID=A0A2T5BC30_MYCDI|nr:DUF3108 domain-containing protein [Mycoplana dimorpha]PTM96542.1 uncharacterized protein DUF3108 [Mycoplana dimorpha]
MNWRRCIAAMGLAAVTAVPAAADEVRHLTDYSIRLAGFPVATASFRSQFDGSRYVISGRMDSAGLAEILASTHGTTSVTGTVSGGKLRAARYSMSYRSGKKARAIDVTFNNGNVVSASLRPERRQPDNWVPVRPADMRSVIDPISGLIIPANSNVCSKTLPIFDGESRMDIRLVDKGTRSFSTDGFNGEVKVCGVRFVPRSGYRKGRRDVEYLRSLTTMEIWFAKAQSVDMYAPVYVRIPTSLGPVTVSATRFGG